ncbi:MAG: GTPase HflX [Eubacteriaceae bacterium]|nr:GTPase HflX [Eubacteriaceae bacterium]
MKTALEAEKAVLFSADGSPVGDRSLEELRLLSEAAGIEVVGEIVQKRERPTAPTYLGSGKAEELRSLAAALGATMAICDDELSGIQLRNLESIAEVKIVDRTILILDIFASRALSKEGKLQVEMALLAYRKSRLTGFGKSLSRLGGGIGTRGPGEMKLETDRRHIARRLATIRRELAEARAERAVQSSQRKKAEERTVALVGYTNAGKSAVMNRIMDMTGNSSEGVLEQDSLFSTLDAFRRKIRLLSGQSFVLIDTVGFVSKLPTALVEAFKSSLEEVATSDLLVHVVDSSYEEREFQVSVVEDTLHEIGASGKEAILAYNKCDLAQPYGVRTPHGALSVSATRGDGMQELLDEIEKRLFSLTMETELLIPYSRGDIVSRLLRSTPVISQEHLENGTLIRTKLKDADWMRYKEYHTDN